MKDEAEVMAGRLLRQISELHASMIDETVRPDPRDVHQKSLSLTAGFLSKEYGLPAAESFPAAARILQRLNQLHGAIRASKGFHDPKAVHEQRRVHVAEVLRQEYAQV